MDNAEKDLEQLHELCDKIKERLVALGMNDFVLFASDYWDEYEDWAEDLEDFDDAGPLGFYMKEVQGGYSYFTTYVRKIKIKDDELVFDLEEIEADDDGDHEIVRSEENMSIDVITDSAHSDNTRTALRCLKSILDNAFDEEDPLVIELNKRRYE